MCNKLGLRKLGEQHDFRKYGYTKQDIKRLRVLKHNRYNNTDYGIRVNKYITELREVKRRSTAFINKLLFYVFRTPSVGLVWVFPKVN